MKREEAKEVLVREVGLTTNQASLVVDWVRDAWWNQGYEENQIPKSAYLKKGQDYKETLERKRIRRQKELEEEQKLLTEIGKTKEQVQEEIREVEANFYKPL